MQFFCYTVLGDGFVERGEIPFRLGNPAVSKRLGDPLPVVAVSVAKAVIALLHLAHLVEAGVGHGADQVLPRGAFQGDARQAVHAVVGEGLLHVLYVVLSAG